MNLISWSNFPLPLVQVNPPSLADSDSVVSKAYEKGIFGNSGELNRRASKELAEHVDPKLSGYLTSNNTMGLTSSLISVGVRGRHVIVSNFTFAATMDAVILAGGIPLVCDIDPETLELDINKVEKTLLNKDFDVAVVMPTRVFGYVTDMSKLIKKCGDHGIPVIIDAAASFPGYTEKWKFEEFALYEVFSLHATKVFGIGEGGLVIGKHEDIEKIRQTSNFGFDLGTSSKFSDGLNAKADEFTAARALARFPKYLVDVEERNEFVKIYTKILLDFPDIRTLNSIEGTVYSYFPIIFPSEEKLHNFQNLVADFILTRRYYYPTLKSGYIGDARVVYDEELKVSESISTRILCLPVYAHCTDEVKIEIEKLLRSALGAIN